MQRVFVFDRPEVGTQHHVEVARFGPVATGATIRAHNILKTVFRQLVAMLFGIGFLKLVCTVALVAVEAFDQWIVEHGHVAGSHPHGRRKNNGRVNAHHIATDDDHGTPPFALDIVFQRDAERTVIPRGTGSAVDFTGGKNKATTLGEGYDFIEFGYSHNAPSGLNGLGSLQAQSLPLRGDRTPPALLFRGVLAFNSVVVKQQRPDLQSIITVFLFRFAYEIYVRTYIYENVLHSPDPGIDWPAPVSGPLYRLNTLCTCRGAFRRKWKLR